MHIVHADKHYTCIKLKAICSRYTLSKHAFFMWFYMRRDSNAHISYVYFLLPCMVALILKVITIRRQPKYTLVWMIVEKLRALSAIVSNFTKPTITRSLTCKFIFTRKQMVQWSLRSARPRRITTVGTVTNLLKAKS